jgi:hypothetical protein
VREDERPHFSKEREKWGTQMLYLGRKRATRLYNHVNPTDELYGDADDPLEIPAL